MTESYYFGLGGRSVGPLEEEAIRARILEGEITGTTLGWRSGMAEWRPVAEIAALQDAFGDLLSARELPPPLPGASAQEGATGPPPLPGQVAAQRPAGLGALGTAAYRFVLLVFPPWGGRKPWVRRYVEAKPRRAPLVAVITLALLALIVFLGVGNLTAPEQPAQGPEVATDRPEVYDPPITGLFPEDRRGSEMDWRYREHYENK